MIEKIDEDRERQRTIGEIERNIERVERDIEEMKKTSGRGDHTRLRLDAESSIGAASSLLDLYKWLGLDRRYCRDCRSKIERLEEEIKGIIGGYRGIET